MLQLENIRKEYKTGSLVQKALDGVSLNFRDCEFAAVLGPSGSGKTTLLNIIGGLDRYDSGDLIINGISTKKYKDRDWDAYRNHTIGFIFQSYNLIPHQSVLENVELALTVSGISRKERKARAARALEDVGLGDQLHKKPSQMSGGQMQRVAIARALVNNPDILVADEPTGALDSSTSVQVMDLLKEVAKDRLVIMVTHNPDLAYEYATRIVELRDGQIVSDSDPYIIDAEGENNIAAAAAGIAAVADAAGAAAGADTVQAAEDIYANEAPSIGAGAAGAAEETNAAGMSPAGADAKGHSAAGGGDGSKKNRVSMSFGTALYLSLKNLLTKKARTLLVAFAGSIGIIGIALILSMSNGVNAYIGDLEEDTMSEYPIEILSTGVSLSSMMEYLTATGTSEAEVTEVKTVSSLLSTVDSNDLASLKTYLESGESGIEDHAKYIRYDYNITPQIFRLEDDGSATQVNPYDALSSVSSTLSLYSTLTSSSSLALVDTFFEMPENEDLYIDQYEVKAGRWPENKNECVLVLAANGMVSDLTLYVAGLKDDSELKSAMDAYVSGETGYEFGDDTVATYNYEDFLGISFKIVNSSDCYVYDEEHGVWTSKTSNEEYMNALAAEGEDLTIVGVVMPKEDATAAMLSSGINYRYDLTTSLIEYAADSDIVKEQLADSSVNVLTGEEFGSDDGSITNLGSLFTIDPEVFSELLSSDTGLSTFGEIDLSSLDPGEIDLSSLDLSSLTDSLTGDTAELTEALAGALENIDMSEINLSDYMDTEDLTAGMPELTEEDLQAILESVNIKLSQEDIQAALTAIIEDYLAYASENRYEEIITAYQTSVTEYLTSDAALEIVQNDIQEIMDKVSADSFSNADVLQIVENVMAGYEAWAEANGVTDLSNYSENLAAYLASEEAVALLEEGVDTLLQKAASAEVSADDLTKIVTDVAEGYSAYAEENGAPSAEDIIAGPAEYLESDSFQKLVTECLLESIDISGAQETIQNIFTEKMSSVQESVTDAIGGAANELLADVMASVTADISDEIAELLNDTLSDMSDQLTQQLQSALSDSMDDIVMQMTESLSESLSIDPESLTDAITMNMNEEELTDLLSSLLSTDSSTYSSVLNDLGYADLDSPYEILIYPLSFEDKDEIIAILDDYNTQMTESGQEEKVVAYTDMVGTLMSSVTTIINVISYVLIAFVSISLIVSSIMIGVITYISVFERKKEIGILRSIGASKRNISSVFNAETFITGLLAGLLGILITEIVLVPGNYILRALTGQENLAAFLQPQAAVILVA